MFNIESVRPLPVFDGGTRPKRQCTLLGICGGNQPCIAQGLAKESTTILRDFDSNAGNNVTVQKGVIGQYGNVEVNDVRNAPAANVL